MIDLFAGPGGLGEGFSAFRRRSGPRPFDIRLSIEKDEWAHRTLRLRSFYRLLRDNSHLRNFRRRLRGEITTEQLFELHPQEAERANLDAWRIELGSGDPPLNILRERVGQSLLNAEPWVLIGGPPCQAYSLAGRSRNKGIDGYRLDKDRRSTLYVEYLQLIADHWPTVFVMENVKGLLSSKVGGQSIFHRITEDLREPRRALQREGRSLRSNGTHRYRLVALSSASMFEPEDASDFIVRSEDCGVPQARHRVIIIGVRSDVTGRMPSFEASGPIKIEQAIGDLPPIRSGLSTQPDSASAWRDTILAIGKPRYLSQVRKAAGAAVVERIERALCQIDASAPTLTRGSRFIPSFAKIAYEREWFTGDEPGGFANHESRSHIPGDLHRYLYAACFAAEKGRSPALCDFPEELLPEHANVGLALDGSFFADRFRVQCSGRPSTTVTSHISKDGHYYIHYDPAQCRSLTVREAARLQTFPDSYLFEGPRTSQYTQVGNAVPPLLARQIAERVYELLK